MRGARRDPHRRVCDDGDLLYVLLMVSNKAKVADHRTKTVPPWKRWRIDDDAGQIAGCLDLWIDRFREFDEVVVSNRDRGRTTTMECTVSRS